MYTSTVFRAPYRLVAGQIDKMCDWAGQKPFKRCLEEGVILKSTDGDVEITKQLASQACPVACFSFNHQK